MSRVSQNANAVVRSVCDLLAAHKIWHMRINTGGLMGAKRFIRFGKKGAADILAIPVIPCWDFSHSSTPGPNILWIECKSGTGRQSPDQRAFQKEVQEAGHYYIITRDGPDNLLAWLQIRGVIR